jgi:hypothetical protein
MRGYASLTAADERAYTFIGEHFQQQRVFDATIDDVHALDATLWPHRARGDLREHAAGQRAVGEQGVDLLLG